MLANGLNPAKSSTKGEESYLIERIKIGYIQFGMQKKCQIRQLMIQSFSQERVPKKKERNVLLIRCNRCNMELFRKNESQKIKKEMSFLFAVTELFRKNESQKIKKEMSFLFAVTAETWNFSVTQYQTEFGIIF